MNRYAPLAFRRLILFSGEWRAATVWLHLDALLFTLHSPSEAIHDGATSRRGARSRRTRLAGFLAQLSFADYHDLKYMQFRALHVINEDRVEPGRGFGMHSHRDMEIISYVLEGTLAHHDSMGNGSVIRPGSVQRMSAGAGVQHSEFNASSSEQLHFLQIWFMPNVMGIPSGSAAWESGPARGRPITSGLRQATTTFANDHPRREPLVH
jgi:hypothetical protein